MTWISTSSMFTTWPAWILQVLRNSMTPSTATAPVATIALAGAAAVVTQAGEFQQHVEFDVAAFQFEFDGLHGVPAFSELTQGDTLFRLGRGLLSTASSGSAKKREPGYFMLAAERCCVIENAK